MPHQDCHPEGEPKLELIPLLAPVPPGLARVFGYRGDARFVAFRWQLGGEEMVCEDGRYFGKGDADAWLMYLQHPAVFPHFHGYHDFETAHALIIDRDLNLASVIPLARVRSFLKRRYFTERVTVAQMVSYLNRWPHVG